MNKVFILSRPLYLRSPRVVNVDLDMKRIKHFLSKIPRALRLKDVIWVLTDGRTYNCDREVIARLSHHVFSQSFRKRVCIRPTTNYPVTRPFIKINYSAEPILFDRSRNLICDKIVLWNVKKFNKKMD